MIAMRPHRFLCIFALSLAVHGLGSPHGWTAEPGTPTPPAFNEKELVAYKGKGRGILTGQVFLAASSGKAVTQAGVPVHLIPMTPSTRYWFDHNVRASSCAVNSEPAPAESPASSRPSSDCSQDALGRLLSERRLLPYLRTTRANPTGHFWFTKIPAGRYYIVSLIDGGGHQDDRSTGIAWLTLELEPGEKAANLVVTNCKSSLC
jgi:hypothetical protein